MIQAGQTGRADRQEKMSPAKAGDFSFRFPEHRDNAGDHHESSADDRRRRYRNFVGQRFAGRLAGDPKGMLTLGETVLVEGEAAQTTTLRWEDYTQTAVDPSDDCTIWYVGDSVKKDAANYSTRIGAFRMSGCR